MYRESAGSGQLLNLVSLLLYRLHTFCAGNVFVRGGNTESVHHCVAGNPSSIRNYFNKVVSILRRKGECVGIDRAGEPGL